MAGEPMSHGRCQKIDREGGRNVRTACVKAPTATGLKSPEDRDVLHASSRRYERMEQD